MRRGGEVMMQSLAIVNVLITSVSSFHWLRPNRASHPSGSSDLRCFAAALVNCFTPEERWYHAPSNGNTAQKKVAAGCPAPDPWWLDT
jgi:hypothetical protein